MTQTIFAEDLKKGSTLIAHATSFVGKRIYNVVSDPILTPLTVKVELRRKYDKHFPSEQREFERKVSLEIITEDNKNQ